MPDQSIGLLTENDDRCVGNEGPLVHLVEIILSELFFDLMLVFTRRAHATNRITALSSD